MAFANPIFKSQWHSNPIRNGAYFYSPPPPPPPPPSSLKPKVVSIPVDFVGSDDNRMIDPSPSTRSDSAIKIQKAIRGFLVRKNVKIAREIEAEVDEIEMKFRREEEMDLIVRDEKERLKINEMLMVLLFRLDSVRGVRDYRKRVIRRVITIQEMLDSISAARSADQTLETVDVSSEMPEDSKPDDVSVAEEVQTLEMNELGEESKTLDSRDQIKPDSVVEEAETPKISGDQISTGWEILETKGGETVRVAGNDGTLGSEKEKGGMKDVMERMVAENEKLKLLVSELCERSAQQCRLMCGLAERVEHLEKIVEKMDRKKKKASSVDGECGRDKKASVVVESGDW